MSRLRGAAWPAITAAMVLAAGAARADAVTWRPVATGIGEAITAIDYRSPTELWFATEGGKVFVRQPDGSFALQAAFPGRHLFDLARRPSGDVALAAADNGQLLRFANGTWSTVSLADTSFDHRCAGDRWVTYPRVTPTKDLIAVAWSSDQVAWAIPRDEGQVLKSVDAGATWADVSRQPDGSCRIAGEVTDVAPVPGSANDVYFITSNGFLERTIDGLASQPSYAGTAAGGCLVPGIIRLAIDPDVPTRYSAVAACGGWEVGDTTLRNAVWRQPDGLRVFVDVAAAPGVFMAVGFRGPAEAFGVSAFRDTVSRGPVASTQWLSVDLADREHAAVGGVGGALALSDNAGPHGRVVLRSEESRVTARRSRGRVRVAVRGQVWRPDGITATQACQGTVRITVRHAKRRLALRTVPLNTECVFATTVTASRRRVGKARRLSVSALFNGNSQLGGSGKTVRVRVRR